MALMDDVVRHMLVALDERMRDNPAHVDSARGALMRLADTAGDRTPAVLDAVALLDEVGATVAGLEDA